MLLSEVRWGGRRLSFSEEDLLHNPKKLAAYRRRSVNHRNAGGAGMVCCECGMPVYLKAVSDGIYGAHFSKERVLKLHGDFEWNEKECSLRVSDHSKKAEMDFRRVEGETHYNAVLQLKAALDNDPLATQVQREKQIRINGEYRKPDCNAMVGGHRVAFEIQRSWMTTEEIAARERFYVKNGIKLIWLYYQENLRDGNSIDIKEGGTVRNLVEEGGYRETYKLGAHGFWFDHEDISNGLSLVCEYEPFATHNEELVLSGVKLISDSVGLCDLIWIEEKPFPVVWKERTLRDVVQSMIDSYKFKSAEERLRSALSADSINGAAVKAIKDCHGPFGLNTKERALKNIATGLKLVCDKKIDDELYDIENEAHCMRVKDITDNLKAEYADRDRKRESELADLKAECKRSVEAERNTLKEETEKLRKRVFAKSATAAELKVEAKIKDKLAEIEALKSELEEKLKSPQEEIEKLRQTADIELNKKRSEYRSIRDEVIKKQRRMGELDKELDMAELKLGEANQELEQRCRQLQNASDLLHEINQDIKNKAET